MYSHFKTILRLGFPIAVGQLGVIIMGFADTMMVGRYNTDSLAAASFVNSIFNLVTFLLLGYSYGLTPLISSLFGRGEKAEAGGTLRHALLCNILFALFLMLLLLLLYGNLDRMGQPAEILPLVRPYYLTMLVSMLFVALFNALRQFTDGITDTSTAMWALLIGNVLNIVGNFFLIYGIGFFPELGLFGAGLSTLFSRIVAAVVLIVAVMSRGKYAVYRKGFAASQWRVGELRRINAQSIPIALQMGMETGAFTFSGIMAGWIGAVELATFQVTNTLGTLGFLLYYSFGAGMSIRLAAFYGTGEWAQVRATARAGRLLLLCMCAISSLIFIFFGENLIQLFTEDVSVIALAVALVPLLVLYQIGDSMQVCYANALRGTSHVRPMMTVAFVSYILVNIPVGYVLAFPLGMGIRGLYLAFTLGLLTAAILFYLNFRKVMKVS